MADQGEISGDNGDRTAIEIGRRIAEARKLAGCSQAELGDLLGVSKRAVQTYENGTTIPWRHFARLAEVLERSIGWFLHGREDGLEGEVQIAAVRVLTEELEAMRDELGADMRTNNGLLVEIRDSLAELTATLAPAAAAIAAAVAASGNVPGLGG